MSIAQLRPSAGGVTDGASEREVVMFDPGTGEDSFEVFSLSTGAGWSLADHLYRTYVIDSTFGTAEVPPRGLMTTLG